MTTTLKRKLRFFRDCFEAENQSKILWSVYSSQIEYLQSLASRTDFSRPKIPLAPAYAKRLTTPVARYQREKQLVLCRFFLHAYHDVGSFGGGTQRRKICCPILYFPVEFRSGEQSSPSVNVDPDRGQINPAIRLFFQSFEIDAEKEFEKLLRLSFAPEPAEPLAIIEQDSVEQILRDLVKRLISARPDLNIGLLGWAVGRPLALNKVHKSLNEDQISFSNHSVTCLIRKQQSAQGVLHELEKMIAQSRASVPLSLMLQDEVRRWAHRIFPFRNPLQKASWRQRHISVPIPAVLNSAQTRAVRNAEEKPLSVVVGPPGTGKSFTIASLAVAEFARGHSVLVVSQNQQAVDVVRRKLIDDFGIEPGLTVLGNEKGVPRDVKNQIQDLLKSSESFDEKDIKSAGEILERVLHQLRGAEREFSSRRDMEVGERQLSIDLIRRRVQHFFSKLSDLPGSIAGVGTRRVLGKGELLSRLLERVEELDQRAHELIGYQINLHYKKIKSVASQSREVRTSLKFFAQAMTARTEGKQLEYYRSVEYDRVLEVLPLWFAAVGNLQRLLPLKRELFDLVIMDEATQSNMAVCLPALQRARRVVIVGDPKQLRHLSFVSRKVQQELFERQRLRHTDISDNFRDNSVIDYALSAVESSREIVQLDEHFRSHPQIIEFSNRRFYRGSLRLMTQKPGDRHRAICLVHCDGERKSGVNRIEAEALMTQLRKLVDQQQHVPEQEAHSIGVLSFFREQAEYLEKALFKEFELNELRKHSIRCGTPFSFQGEERDQMLISCCVDFNTSASAYNYLNRDDVFNVAITRARDRQTLFLSCTSEQMNPGSLLQSYVKYCDSLNQRLDPTGDSGADAYQDEVCAWLESSGVRTFRNFPVAGTPIDIVAVYQERSLAIDLIGFKGEMRGALELDQYRLLNRAGLPSFLMPYREWQGDQKRLLEALSEKLGLVSGSEQPLSGESSASNVSASSSISNADEQRCYQLFQVFPGALQKKFTENQNMRAARQTELLVFKFRRFLELSERSTQSGGDGNIQLQNAFVEVLRLAFGNLNQISMGLETIFLLLEQQKVDLSGYLPEQEKQQVVLDGKEDEDLGAIHRQRALLIEEQQKLNHRLMLENESALLQLDRTIIKLSGISKSGQIPDSGSAQKILKDLTERFDLLSKS